MRLLLFVLTFAGIQVYVSADKPAPTPVAPPCPQSLCAGKSDGNYNIPSFPHDFVQCANGIAYCQSCWPQSLMFNQTCNQCLYPDDTACYTTKAWVPQPTPYCPDECPGRGQKFSGNIADVISNKGKGNPNHYVACWMGVTMGCISCPSGLKFNEESNACLYDGLYFTEPSQKK